MRLVLVCATSCLLLLPTWASNPGEPLDCSDWVILEPGLSCTQFISYPCSNPLWCPPSKEWVTTDNVGRSLRLRRFQLGSIPCSNGSTIADAFRTELIAFDGVMETVVAFIEDRCADVPFGIDRVTPDDPTNDTNSVRFDVVQGSLYVGLMNHSFSAGLYPVGYSVVRLDGFTSVFEVMQTYTPTANLGFRVPYMPEGFQFADWFDTYYGDLATVGDWSQAQPLQCGCPVSTPGVGDYLTVDDPLRDPAPGTGRYYVTAVNHIGQRRYGRKRTAGVLSGRDPGVLPTCDQVLTRGISP